MATKNVLISLDRHDSEIDLDKASTELAKAGLKIIDVMKISKIIAGVVEEEKIGGLKEVKGVASVDLDREYKAQ